MIPVDPKDSKARKEAVDFVNKNYKSEIPLEDGAVESQTTTRLFTRVFEVGGRGSFLQFLRERAIERRDTLCRRDRVWCQPLEMI